MKLAKIVVIGLILWSLTLVWPEFNLVLLAAPLLVASLTGALLTLVGLYTIWVRGQLTPGKLAAAYIQTAHRSPGPEPRDRHSLHTQPTRPYSIGQQARDRHSQPTRPMPQL